MRPGIEHNKASTGKYGDSSAVPLLRVAVSEQTAVCAALLMNVLREFFMLNVSIRLYFIYHIYGTHSVFFLICQLKNGRWNDLRKTNQ